MDTERDFEEDDLEEERGLGLICGYCQTPFEGNEVFCRRCGGPRTKAVFQEEEEGDEFELRRARAIHTLVRALAVLLVLFVALLAAGIALDPDFLEEGFQLARNEWQLLMSLSLVAVGVGCLIGRRMLQA